MIDTRLRTILQSWVQSGGMLSGKCQPGDFEDQSLLGVTLGGRWSVGGFSLVFGRDYLQEPSYLYKPVTVGSASVLATTGSVLLITSNTVGSGRVILTTPEPSPSARYPTLVDWGPPLRLAEQASRAGTSVRPSSGVSVQ